MGKEETGSSGNTLTVPALFQSFCLCS